MIRTAPFEAHEYLADDAAQLAALADAYESRHIGVIDAVLANVIRARAASCDTHPKDGDSTEIEAPLVSGAVPHGDAADAQGPSQ